MTYAVLSVEEANDLLAKEDRAVLIDVREKSEFAEERALGARNFPLSAFDAATVIRTLELSENDVVCVICRSGRRSEVACKQLALAGCPRVYNVEGGTVDWLAKGLPSARRVIEEK